jgi:hypothetical protein
MMFTEKANGKLASMLECTFSTLVGSRQAVEMGEIKRVLRPANLSSMIP